MTNMEFLKKQHLDMFEQKRKEHKSVVSSLYQQYISDKDIKQEGVLNSLIKTFFEAGDFHLAVNTVDAKLLEEAKQRQSEHTDIIVKISGYSTQFTTLNEKIQDAVIKRAVKEE